MFTLHPGSSRERVSCEYLQCAQGANKHLPSAPVVMSLIRSFGVLGACSSDIPRAAIVLPRSRRPETLNLEAGSEAPAVCAIIVFLIWPFKSPGVYSSSIRCPNYSLPIQEFSSPPEHTFSPPLLPPNNPKQKAQKHKNNNHLRINRRTRIPPRALQILHTHLVSPFLIPLSSFPGLSPPHMYIYLPQPGRTYLNRRLLIRRRKAHKLADRRLLLRRVH